MIDRNKLDSLLSSDEMMINKFLGIFKTQTPIQLMQLKDAINTNKWPQASITAHAIKSQCNYLGLEEIADLALEIEQLTEEKKELGLIPGLAEQLESKILIVIENELNVLSDK